MEGVEQGIVGVITNHSWLDNPTFKGMRKSLMATFNQLYIFDLHGSSAESGPDGSKDENVFDIKKGVAISLFVKGKGLEPGVWYHDIWGTRLSKYRALASGTKASITWKRLTPDAPDWLFRPQDAKIAKKYRTFWSIPSIFSPLGDPAPGIVTTQDEFAISFSPDDAKKKVQNLLKTSSEEEARRHFRLCSQNQWSYARSKLELPNINLNKAAVEVLYRPFDKRWTIWDRNVAVHRRERVMQHMLQPNLALLTARSNKSSSPDHFFVSEVPSETKAAESTIQSYCFPLFAYLKKTRRENIGTEFRAFLDEKYGHHYSPEEILGYIYAVVYAPSYRNRYAEFLRNDFPRVPLPKSGSEFEVLSGLGWALVQAHLLRELPRQGLAAYYGKGDHTVDALGYSPSEQAVSINKTQFFKPVPPPVWEFHIGGYQVLDKYLKARKNRALSLDEINHVAAIADSLAFTIEQMNRIERSYASAFRGGG
jgi:predicted helicase